MAHGDARERKWRGNWRMEWVASTLTLPRNIVYPAFTKADAHTSAASIRQNRCPRRFKWTSPFRRKTKSGFCACAITFQTHYISELLVFDGGGLRHVWSLTMAQMVTRWSSTAEDRIFSQGSLCAICGGKSGNFAGFSPSSLTLFHQYHSNNAPYSSIQHTHAV